jgi:hypothetical protein
VERNESRHCIAECAPMNYSFVTSVALDVVRLTKKSMNGFVAPFSRIQLTPCPERS